MISQNIRNKLHHPTSISLLHYHVKCILWKEEQIRKGHVIGQTWDKRGTQTVNWKRQSGRRAQNRGQLGSMLVLCCVVIAVILKLAITIE